MIKKIYFITFILLLSSIVLINLFNIYKEQDSESSIIEAPEVEPVDGDLTTPIIENDPIILLSNLVFDSGIHVDEFIEYGDDYIAIGSQNNYPYMQLIKMKDNYLVVDEVKTTFNLFEGKITDIVLNNHYIEATILDAQGNLIKQNFFTSNQQIIPFYKEQLNINYSKGVTIEPKYVVIHETANTNVGADADAHYRYWSTNTAAKASAHFVVDSTQIYQMLELNQMAWHVGDNDGYSDIINSNTIGIEIAVNADGNYEEARQHTIELTIKLMKELNMDISQLKMHNEASGKRDPITMLNDPSLWLDFVDQVKVGLEN